MTNMTAAERIELIRTRLTSTLSPTVLDIIDESRHHQGHVGAQKGGGHYTVRIASAQFAEKTPLQCHRMVYDALGDAMHTQIHAVSIDIIR